MACNLILLQFVLYWFLFPNIFSWVLFFLLKHQYDCLYYRALKFYFIQIYNKTKMQEIIYKELIKLSLSYHPCGGLVAKLCPTLGTPSTVACHAPLSMEFYRQEYWSGLPFLLQGIFLMQELNPGLLNHSQSLYQLSYKGSSIIYVALSNI